MDLQMDLQFVQVARNSKKWLNEWYEFGAGKSVRLVQIRVFETPQVFSVLLLLDTEIVTRKALKALKQCLYIMFPPC